MSKALFSDDMDEKDEPLSEAEARLSLKTLHGARSRTRRPRRRHRYLPKTRRQVLQPLGFKVKLPRRVGERGEEIANLGAGRRFQEILGACGTQFL